MAFNLWQGFVGRFPSPAGLESTSGCRIYRSFSNITLGHFQTLMWIAR